MSEIKVTVLLPSLNVVNYIRNCVNSVMNQTLREIEILCIDAGSTDGTIEIIKKLAEIDSRIRLIHSDRKSYGYQMNIGVRMAKGKYIDIVETDDYILPNMLESLYRQAEEFNLDYIKSNYINRITQGNREFFRDSFILDNNLSYLYNKVINPREFPELQSQSSAIWNGIYKKETLLSKNIMLNESQGAAFQDIGFYHILCARAERVMYVPEKYYVYFENRNTNSSSSPKGLIYCRNEFKRLFDIMNEDEIANNKRYIIQRIINIYLFGQTDKALRIHNYEVDYYDIIDPLVWFKETINEAKKDGSLHFEDLTEKAQTNLNDIMESIYIYSAKLKKRDHEKEEEIRQKKNILNSFGKPIILFGAGVRGRGFLYQAFLADIDVIAITDNSKNLWGTCLGHIPVIEPEETITRYPSAVYVIANKTAEISIYKQLIQMGISEKHIFRYSPNDGIQKFQRVDSKN